MFRVRCVYRDFEERRTVHRFRKFERAFMFAKRRAFERMKAYPLAEGVFNTNACTVDFRIGNAVTTVFVATIVDEADDPKPEEV